jgi:hypothetical protein
MHDAQQCVMLAFAVPQALVDSLVPGRSPSEVLQDVQRAAAQRAATAQASLQSLLPLEAVSGLLGVWNSTVDGLLREMAASSQQLRVGG